MRLPFPPTATLSCLCVLPILTPEHLCSAVSFPRSQLQAPALSLCLLVQFPLHLPNSQHPSPATALGPSKSTVQSPLLCPFHVLQPRLPRAERLEPPAQETRA